MLYSPMSGSGYFFVFHEVIQKPRHLFSYVRTWLGHRCPQSDPLPPTRRRGRKNRWRSHRIIFWGRAEGLEVVHITFTHISLDRFQSHGPQVIAEMPVPVLRRERKRDVMFTRHCFCHSWSNGCLVVKKQKDLETCIKCWKDHQNCLWVRIQSGTWWSLVL